MIVIRLKGGMGNQMFQYALGRRLSLKHKTVLKLDTALLETSDPNVTKREYDLSVFNTTVEMAKPAGRFLKVRPTGSVLRDFLWCCRIRGIIREKNSRFDPSVLETGCDACLEGSWQSEKYFQEIADTIRRDFQLRETMPAHVAKLADRIVRTRSVCVHVRRGDLVNPPNSKAVHGPCCGFHYFNTARGFIREKVPDASFFIFSDDSDWCRQHLLAGDSEVVDHSFAGSKSQYHLKLMSVCKHQIISNSSFSWWSAWLNENPEKIVIAPKRWTNEAEESPDRIPSSWISM